MIRFRVISSYGQWFYVEDVKSAIKVLEDELRRDAVTSCVIDRCEFSPLQYLFTEKSGWTR
jgi:hypothetical protein